jgi:hypothetical protein
MISGGEYLELLSELLLVRGIKENDGWGEFIYDIL